MKIKLLRSEFEKKPHVKSRLQAVSFVEEENTYLPLDWADEDAVNAMHFINGAWYAYQEQQKKIDDALNEIGGGIRGRHHIAYIMRILKGETSC